MIVTGVAIGHVPDKKEKPAYLLLECRKLFNGD
jgi:hypothetical protein